MGSCISRTSGQHNSGYVGSESTSSNTSPSRAGHHSNAQAESTRLESASPRTLKRQRDRIEAQWVAERHSELSSLGRSALPESSSSNRRTNTSFEQMAVTEVLSRVRNEYYRPNMKSSNKMKSGGGDEEILRVENARYEILRMRGQAMFDQDTDQISVAMEGRAHNCAELAQLAKLHLEDKGFVARTLDFKADHRITVIGADHGGLPSDMKDWDSNIYVCDPWCNIACRGSDYPDKFLAKMEKWQKEGKLIKVDNRGFVSPLDDQWLEDILEGGKTAN